MSATIATRDAEVEPLRGAVAARGEVTSGGRLVYAPDRPCVVWTEADRAKGQAWHNPTVHTFRTYGTPPFEVSILK